MHRLIRVAMPLASALLVSGELAAQGEEVIVLALEPHPVVAEAA